MRGTIAVRTASTRRNGEFELDSVPVGEYRLRVLRIGYEAYDRHVAMTGPADSIRIEMLEFGRLRDSLREADYKRRLAAARARPRHWDCRVPSGELRKVAEATYEGFFGSNDAMREAGIEYGMPPERSAFIHDFRVVKADECRRLGEAFDRQNGLVQDQLFVFRVGKIYWFPGDGNHGDPMAVGLDGKIIGVWVVGN